MKLVKLGREGKFVVLLANGAQTVYANEVPILLRTSFGKWHRNEEEMPAIRKFIDAYLQKADSELATIMEQDNFYALVGSL